MAQRRYKERQKKTGDRSLSQSPVKQAEREGFEPSIPCRMHAISNRAH